MYTQSTHHMIKMTKSESAQKAPLFQAMFRIIDSKYLFLGLIYLIGVGLHNLCTEHRNLVPTNWSIEKELAHHPILAKFKPWKEYQDSFSLCYFLLLKCFNLF